MTDNYYINGNTVRELDTPVRPQRKSREEIERSQRRKSRRNAARRNRQRAMGMSRSYVSFLTVCVIIVALSSAALVSLQAQVTARMNRIAALQSQLGDLRADNDAKYKNMMTSVDLNYISDVAVKELGMTYPREDQIVYYTVETRNYMDQYFDIP